MTVRPPVPPRTGGVRPQPPAAVVTPVSEPLRVQSLMHIDPAECPDYTEHLRVPGGTFKLRPEQNLALNQILRFGGLVAEITMGGGKGLISMVAPVLLRKFGAQCRSVVLVIPAKLEDTYWRERAKFAKHFQLANDIRVVSYDKLSRDGGDGQPTLLETLKPDWIFCDEADKFRNTKSARARRFLAYLDANPQCRTAFLSGTLTRKKIADYAHFVQRSLRSKAYVPVKTIDVEAWGAVLDVDANPDTECLRHFQDILPREWTQWDNAVTQKWITNWYRTRRSDAPGSVVSHGSDAQFPLIMRELPLSVPSVITEALHDLEMAWCRPDGEELETSLAMLMTRNQLTAGCYYLWDWPKNPDGTYNKDDEWLDARAAYHKAVRNVLNQNIDKVNSPMDVANALLRGLFDGTGTGIHLRVCYDAWHKVKHRWNPHPPVKVVWLSSYLLDAACQWAIERLEKGERGIIWFKHRAVGVALRARGLPVFMDEGQTFDYNVQVCAASIGQYHRGFNMQDDFSMNLLLEWDPSLDTMEQLIARTHRPRAPTATEPDGPQHAVYFDHFAHTEAVCDMIEYLQRQTDYVDRTTGRPLKMLVAQWESRSHATP